MSKKLTTEEFIQKAKLIHNNKYDYSKVEYINSGTRICIICPEHGKFWQTPNNHLNCQQKCRKCTPYYKPTNEIFIQKAIKIHGNLYDYSKIQYIDSYTKICIICSKHGEFWQRPNDHINSQSKCPNCQRSKGEEQIELWLIEHNIQYETQKTFQDCKGTRRTLPFDFYLKNYNLIIEYDGKQHFESIPVFGGRKGLKITTTNDNLKNQYCYLNHINILRIPYWKLNKIPIILLNHFL